MIWFVLLGLFVGFVGLIVAFRVCFVGCLRFFGDCGCF